MGNPYLLGSDVDTFAGMNRATGPVKWQMGQGRGMQQAVGVLGRPGQGQTRPGQLAQAFEAARGDEAIIGMDSGAALIAAGLTLPVLTAPQKPCILTRMVVSDATADFFTMSSLTVGVEPILLTNGVNISLAAFTAASNASDFRSVLCHVGNTITAVVTNLDGAAHRFIASLYAVPWTFYGPGA